MNVAQTDRFDLQHVYKICYQPLIINITHAVKKNWY